MEQFKLLISCTILTTNLFEYILAEKYTTDGRGVTSSTSTMVTAIFILLGKISLCFPSAWSQAWLFVLDFTITKWQSGWIQGIHLNTLVFPTPSVAFEVIYCSYSVASFCHHPLLLLPLKTITATPDNITGHQCSDCHSHPDSHYIISIKSLSASCYHGGLLSLTKSTTYMYPSSLKDPYHLYAKIKSKKYDPRERILSIPSLLWTLNSIY